MDFVVYTLVGRQLLVAHLSMEILEQVPELIEDLLICYDLSLFDLNENQKLECVSRWGYGKC